MTENVGYASMQIIPSFRGFEAATRRELSGKLDGVGREAGESLGRETSDGFGRGVSGMSKYAKAAAVGVTVAIGAGLIGIGKWGLGIASANEQADISFTTMLGSAEKAGAFLEDLRDFAAETPFEFPELQTAASTLVSAGIEAGKVIPIMTTLGDVTAGMGTGSEGIKRATVALQQMQAAGKITGEDLNQLRDAGIPVYDLLAAATGKAKTEVSALAQAGKLGKTELDQLMGALESGAGLERFNGLMDKQSESLSGLGSTLKDNLGQGLATAMEPTVGLLKDALPTITDLANKGVGVFGDALAKSIEAGQDFAAWITPIAQDIGDHLMPVLGDVVEIGQNTLPDALAVAGGAVVGFQHVVTPLIDAIGAGTGFLADHESAIYGAAAAYGAWKLVPWLDRAGDAFDTFAIKAYDGVGNSKVLANLSLIGSGAKDAAAGMFALPDAAERVAPRFSTGVGNMSTGIKNLAGTTVSGTTAAGAGIAAFAIGASLAFESLERSAKHGEEAADRFLKSLQIDEGSTDATQRGVSKINEQIQDLTKEANRSNFVQIGQRLNPFDKNTIDEAQSEQKRLSGVLLDYAKDLSKVYGAAKILGTSADSVDAWVDKLKLDKGELGPKRIAAAIDEARNAANNGTPSTDKLTEAYKTLAAETSTSTEKIDAWKDALDEALDKPQSLFDATTAYSQGLEDFRKTLTEGAWGGFGTDTEAGRNNRDALSGMVDNVQNLAHAYADIGRNDKAAETIRQGREQIVEAGKAAGFSDQQVQDYMESLGLTEGTWKSQIELSGADGAKTKADDLRNSLKGIPKSVHSTVYLDIVSSVYDAGIASGAIEHQGAGQHQNTSGDAGKADKSTGAKGDAPAGDAPAAPKAGGDKAASAKGGRRRSGASNVTINTPSKSTRAIADELLWAS